MAHTNLIIAKYRITFKSGDIEIASNENEMMEIIEQCIDASWVYQWAADGLEQDRPSDEDVRFYTLDNAHMCLTDYGCSINNEVIGPDAHDIATGDPQMTPDDITAHSEGLDCGMEDCERCKPDQEIFEGTGAMLDALTIRSRS